MKKITASRSRFGNKWYINIRNTKNGKTIGDGGEGYASKANAIRAIQKNWGDGYTFEALKDMPNSITFRMVPHVAPNR